MLSRSCSGFFTCYVWMYVTGRGMAIEGLSPTRSRFFSLNKKLAVRPSEWDTCPTPLVKSMAHVPLNRGQMIVQCCWDADLCRARESLAPMKKNPTVLFCLANRPTRSKLASVESTAWFEKKKWSKVTAAHFRASLFFNAIYVLYTAISNSFLHTFIPRPRMKFESKGLATSVKLSSLH